MIQSIGDFESWRDSQYDRPEPDSAGPDQRSFRFYSHDHSADTTLEYTLTGSRAELRLSFSSEDPDMGVEEMLYAGENGESMSELVADLRADLTAYLDDADTSSFREQQGISPPDGIHSRDDYFGEYSRTALYAFESVLRQTERETVQGIRWEPLPEERQDWVWSADNQADLERGCIGHLRGDFGSSGEEFWTSWFDHQAKLKSQVFREELQDVVNGLRKEGGLLQSFAGMSSQCRKGLACDESFGFQAQTRDYTYCLRCTPRRGDYNFYLYAYDRNAQRERAQEKASVESVKQQPHKDTTKKKEMER